MPRLGRIDFGAPSVEVARGPAAAFRPHLQPLSAGNHTITFGGFAPDFDYTLDVTYHVTVA